MGNENKIEEYQDKLNKLNKMIVDADRELAISETNLNHYEEQKKTLVEECEAILGDDISKLDEVLNQKVQELDAIMARVNLIDMNNPTNEDNIKVIQSIVKDFSIPIEAIQ